MTVSMELRFENDGKEVETKAADQSSKRVDVG